MKTKNRENSNSNAGLRKKAESKLKSDVKPQIPSSSEKDNGLRHELQVHQIELEMQNAELRKAQKELETSHKKYADLYNFAPVGYVTLNRDGLILEANFTFASLAGVDRGYLINKPFHIFIDSADQDIFFLHKRRVFSDRTADNVELRIKSKETPNLYVKLESVPDNEDHKKVQTCRTVISDITTIKQAEAELRRHRDALDLLVSQRTAELAESNQRLIAANKELDAFNFSVSHDLRAPLRTISGFIKILRDDYGSLFDDTGKDYLRRIVDGSEKMGQLIDDLLRLSGISRTEIKHTKVDLGHFASTLAEELKKEDPDRDVEFIIGNIIVNGDIGLLKIAIENLIRNAWKFSSKQPHARIEFSSQKYSNKTIYYIRDNGIGFDMRYADKLFNPFSRLHSEREFQGTGIGLAIVRRIIERHGGKIWAESEVGKGATFYFEIPA